VTGHEEKLLALIADFAGVVLGRLLWYEPGSGMFLFKK
jgi:hypothetical protein